MSGRFFMIFQSQGVRGPNLHVNFASEAWADPGGRPRGPWPPPLRAKCPSLRAKVPRHFGPNFGAKNLESGAKLSFSGGLRQNAPFEGEILGSFLGEAPQTPPTRGGYPLPHPLHRPATRLMHTGSAPAQPWPPPEKFPGSAHGAYLRNTPQS